MKKFILLAVVAATFAACSNNSESSETKDTTAAVIQDTVGVVKETTVDTIGKGVDENPIADTTKK